MDKKSAPDVRVRVGSGVVAVQVEEPVIRVLAIVATNVENHAGRIIVAIIANG